MQKLIDDNNYKESLQTLPDIAGKKTIIEELHMFPAVGMQEDQRWIPCSERLPKEKQRVIVRCATVGTTVGWILWGEWMTDLGRGCADVTHWMPLPQPPKEVQGND